MYFRVVNFGVEFWKKRISCSPVVFDMSHLYGLQTEFDISMSPDIPITLDCYWNTPVHRRFQRSIKKNCWYEWFFALPSSNIVTKLAKKNQNWLSFRTITLKRIHSTIQSSSTARLNCWASGFILSFNYKRQLIFELLFDYTCWYKIKSFTNPWNKIPFH